MSLALSAIAILAIVMPGFILLHGYGLEERVEGSRTEIPYERIVAASLISLAIHAIFLAMVNVVGGFFGIQINLDATFDIIAQTQSPQTSFASVLSENYLFILLYFFVVYGVSFAMGILGWQLIRWQELDLRFNCLRLNDWYYQFSDTREQLRELGDPKVEIAIYAAVVVETPCCNFLYRGWVRAFRSNRKGGLERLHLQDCIRRVIPDDDESTDGDSEGRYYPVNCDSFFVEGSAIKNLSVQYVYLEPIDSDGEPDEPPPEGPKDPFTLALRRKREQDAESTDTPSI